MHQKKHKSSLYKRPLYRAVTFKGLAFPCVNAGNCVYHNIHHSRREEDGDGGSKSNLFPLDRKTFSWGLKMSPTHQRVASHLQMGLNLNYLVSSSLNTLIWRMTLTFFSSKILSGKTWGPNAFIKKKKDNICNLKNILRYHLARQHLMCRCFR